MISSGSTWEERYGYSRAVVAGDRVFVSGTAPVMPGDADPPADAYGQARRCLEIVLAALDQAGATAADVVRPRIFVTNRAHMDEVERLAVEEHVLLLHAQGVRVALAVGVVEHAPTRREALPGDRCGIDLLHA